MPLLQTGAKRYCNLPYWLDAPLHCENLHSEAAQENRGNEDT